MTTVTLEEARERLPELIQLMAAGEKVVIAEGEQWLASLAAPPPKPPTPEELAAQEERAWEAVRAIRALRDAHSASKNGTAMNAILDEQRQHL